MIRLLLLLMLLPLFGIGQSVLPLRADTVRIEKVGSNGELQVKNATRTTRGPLSNVGNGVTRFIQTIRSGDTLFIAGDTIMNARKVDTIYRKAGQDSLFFTINGIERAVKDSSGAAAPILTATQIAYGSGTNTITSEAALNYDATINRLNADSLKTIFNRGDSAAYGPRYNYVLDSIWYSGTSITAGTGPSSNRQRFTTITSNRLDALESNNGVSGGSMWIHGIAQIPFIPVYSATKYRWMVLEWIVNDIQLGVTDTATAAAAYLRYIDTCLARGWPAQKILILSPSYIDPSIFTNATLLRQSDFRTMVQDVAARRNTLHLDIWGIQVSRGGTLLLIDGIHPSDYGSSGGWSEPIIKKLGNTVRAKGQELQVNGLAEIQRLRLRTADTLTYKAVPVGMDSTGTLAPYQKDAIILNSALTPGPQSANINLTGRAYFGNVTSPTTPEIVQVTGMVKATSLRATGTSPNGLTGNGVEIFMNGSNGGIISYNRDAASGLVLSLNGVGGGQVVVNDLVSSGGPEKLYVNGNAKFGVGQFTSNLPGGMTGSGMELGRISSTVGYIGAYNRDATSALNLSFMPLGGNTYFKSLSDNGSGLDFQFNGKTNFTDTARLNARFSYHTNLHSTFTQYTLIDKSYLDSVIAALGGADGNGLYGGNGGAGGDGSLPGNTTIIGAGNTLTITGTQSSSAAFNVNNTGNGSAGAFSTTGTGSALSGTNSSSGNGLFGSSSSGNGLSATSVTGLAGRFKITPSSTNTIVSVLDVIAGSSGTPAAGRGAAINLKQTDDGGNDVTGVQLSSVFTSAATGSTSSEMQIKTTNAGSNTLKFTLKADGQQRLHNYGVSTFTGTATTSAQFDVNGNIIEGPAVTSGTYTPTLTNTTNVAASTAYQFQWSRVGNTITFSGEVDIDPTSGLTLTVLTMTLPIVGSFANPFECAGTAADDLGTVARVRATASAGTAEVRMTPSDVTNRRFSVHGTYLFIAP